MPRLALMCGLAGAGKSTVARRLESDGWLRLSIDVAAWEQGYTLHPLPGPVRDAIVASQREELVVALTQGRDVVVDYAFWSRSMRDEYRSLGTAHGAKVEVLYLDVPVEELRRRLAARAAQEKGPDAIAVDEELLARFVAGFEPPGPDEMDVRRL